MATTYKGLTIKFGGDTTQLSTALKKVQGEAKTTQTDLKAINQSLKFNPGNTDLLKQKQQALNAAYDQTKVKLNAYKQGLAQLEAKKQRGEQLTASEQRQYNQLQRSILTCENQLKRYGEDLKKVTIEAKASETGLYKLGQTIDKNKEKLAAAGDKMQTLGKAAAAASTALAGAGVAAFSEVETGYESVVKKTGASGKQLEAMKKSVSNIATQIPTDFKTAGDAVGQVNTRFGVTGKELESLSTSFVKFAQLNDTDVTTSVDGVQKAMAAFGLDTKQAKPFLDALTKAGQATGVSMSTLTSGLVNNGTAFKSMGLSANQAVLLMGQLETSGANADTVMGGLRKALKNATDSGIPLDKALSDLQATISGSKKGVDGLQAAYDLFGKSGDQVYAAVQSGAIDFSTLANSATTLNGSIGTVDSTFENSITTQDKMKVAVNNLKEAGAQLGEQFVPVVDKIAGVVKGLAEKFKALSPEQKGFIANIIKVGAVGGAAVFAIGKVVSIVSTMGAAFRTASIAIAAMRSSQLLATIATKAGAAAQWLMNAAMSANPIGIVVVAIGALVAALALFFTKTETGRKIWAAFTKGLKETWDKFVTWIKPILEKVWGFFKGLWDNIKKFAAGFVKAFLSIPEKVKAIFTKVKDFITKPIETAKNFIKGIIDKIKGFFSNFKIQLPKIKLPHFVINPPGWQLGDLLEGKIPSLGIEWYAKGGVIPPNSPRLVGVGDSREREWIEPESKLLKLIESAVSNVASGETNVNVSIAVDAKITGQQSAYQLGQNIGAGINSVLKQRGLSVAKSI